MGQTWTADVYAASHAAATDLQNIETNFATLRSSFSGTTAPSNTEVGLHWMDTSKKVLKVRDDDDSGWWGLMHGDSNQKIPVYRNAAMDGWVVDSSSATDRVLAIKGGSTYTTGGDNAGTWTQPDHFHGLPDDYHGGWNGTLDGQYMNAGGASYRVLYWSSAPSFDIPDNSDGGATANTYRPAAAVFTLQYLDL
jgi:hypothetical protein